MAIEGLFAQERVAERRRGLIEVAHQVLLSLLQLNFVAAAEEALKEVALALEGPKSALHLPILKDNFKKLDVGESKSHEEQ